MDFGRLTVPEGQRVEYKDGMPVVPNNPVVVLLEGDGIGRSVNGNPGITDAAIRCINAAVAKAYGDEKKISWMSAFAGDSARSEYHPEVSDDDLGKMSEDDQRAVYIPDDTLNAIKHFGVALKGPLTTPVGGGFRSINVFLRKHFDLYACVRPVRYFEGVPAPNINADRVDMVIFRENVEDVYTGIEFEVGSEKQKKLQQFLCKELGFCLRQGWEYGFGVKPMSKQGSQRLIRKAVLYAQSHKYDSVTLMHKGNIMKFTEGAFRKWGYELIQEEFSDTVVAEGEDANGKIVMNDRIADSMFQQIQTRPAEYGVIACPNLDGDYLSDALAALVGGLGLAPGANIGDNCAIFEATHGSAPKYEGQDKANPGSMILSGAMLLDYLGWSEAAVLLRDSVAATIKEAAHKAEAGEKKLPVTYDLARQFPGLTADAGAKSSEFANRIIELM